MPPPQLAAHEVLFARMDPGWQEDSEVDLGAAYDFELAITSKLWIQSGYQQGIVAYLNFFLLKDFIELHDIASPSRFESFRSMADSFYQTDLFVRDVTDSGVHPGDGIRDPKVRALLRGIMQRHQRVSIPPWMMTYFGFQLLEAVEQEAPEFRADERAAHLVYMCRAYRIMGIPFSADRGLMQEFARAVEKRFAGTSENLAKYARNILLLGEMVGVSSSPETITARLPAATRRIYAPLHRTYRPGILWRGASRLAGRLLVKKAIGQPRAGRDGSSPEPA